jgi:2-isopropylmalate synthase
MSRAESPATGTPVLIDTTDGARTWSTMGVSENIIEGSWRALSDSIVYGVLHAENQE